MFYKQYFDWHEWETLVIPALITLTPPLVFSLGSGWLLGQYRPWLIYVWMAAPLLCAALPLPEVLGLWNGSFFTEYPLSLGTLDPAFSVPPASMLAQWGLLGAGAGLLVFRPGREP